MPELEDTAVLIKLPRKLKARLDRIRERIPLAKIVPIIISFGVRCLETPEATHGRGFQLTLCFNSNAGMEFFESRTRDLFYSALEIQDDDKSQGGQVG